MRHGMLPQDLYRMRLAGEPQLSPDGRQVCFALTRLDEPSNEYVAEL